MTYKVSSGTLNLCFFTHLRLIQSVASSNSALWPFPQCLSSIISSHPCLDLAADAHDSATRAPYSVFNRTKIRDNWRSQVRTKEVRSFTLQWLNCLTCTMCRHTVLLENVSVKTAIARADDSVSCISTISQ